MPTTTAATLTRPDGVELAYEVTGTETDPAVVLVHGFGVTLRMWDPTLAPLVAAGWRVVTFDLRGHGHTTTPDDQALFTLDAVVDDLLALADHLDAEQFVVGGLSMGGFITLATWVRAPTRILGLVLADTGPGFRKDEARAAWNATTEATATRFETEGLSTIVSIGATGRTAPAALGLDRHAGPAGLARAARGILAQSDARGVEALPTIDVPTLVVVGEHDTAFLGAAEMLEAKIPDAHREVIPDAGHVCNVDNPEVFNDVLVDFLDGI